MQNLVEKHRFEIKNETEDQGQSIPKLIGTLVVLRCIFLSKLGNTYLQLVVTFRADNSHAQNELNFYFKFNLTLKVKVNRPTKQ